MDTSIYVDYFDANIENLAKKVDERLSLSKDYIRTELIKELKDCLVPCPVHYVLKFDGNPYDCSGIIVKDGFVDLNQTVGNFLEEEYSGTKQATYISGMGWHYDTYEDDLRDCSLGLAVSIMYSVIQECIEDEFSVALSEDDFEQIKFDCGEFDEVYDNSLASSFFMSSEAVSFVGIENMKLVDILDES